MTKTASLALGAVLLVLGSFAEAQQTEKSHRLGFLSGGFPGPSHWTTRLRAELRELGYVEGKSITIESRYSENRLDRSSALAEELVRLRVDIIVVAGGDIPIQAAMNATKTIPIILTGQGSDPVKAGFIQSLARPGGNVTGVTGLSTELGGKRLELLKEAVPKLARVAVLYNPDTPGTAREVREDFPVAARALGLTIRPLEARDADGLEKVSLR